MRPENIKRVTGIKFKQSDDFVEGYKIESKDLGKRLYIPNGFDENNTIVITYITAENEEKKYDIKFSKLTKNKLKDKDYIEYPKLKAIRQYYEVIDEKDSFDIINLEHGFNSKFTFEDITDNEFNNFASLTQNSLENDGLWINSGIRRIRIDISNISKISDIDSSKKDSSEESAINNYLIQRKGLKIGAKGRLIKKDNIKLTNPQDFIVKRNIDKTCFILELDTDKIGVIANDKPDYLFTGIFEIQMEKTNEKQGVSPTVEKVGFKFEIRFKNPRICNDGKEWEHNPVSIDFGTSSTCIAYDKGKKMFAFTDNPKGIADYENPTSILLYNWRKIFSTWDKKNKTVPHFNRSKAGYRRLNKYTDHFEYGHEAWNQLREPIGKIVKANISNIKSLPGLLLKENAKETVTPYLVSNNSPEIVYLTLELETENEETLNPIALYGYLIGRNVNLQIRNKVYTTYKLTMPVDFSPEKREIIRKSLEYGIKRSVPAMLRNEVNLQIDYDEPVALLGSVKKHIKPSNVPRLFSVFDFGGGTLDFAFGMCRTTSKEHGVFEDEEEKLGHKGKIIEIFNTGGVQVGGETLIRALSYEIYKRNEDIMSKYKIPFCVPDDEDEIEDFPAGLFGEGDIGKCNLKLFNEFYSRPFFKNKEIDEDIQIELFDKDDNAVYERDKIEFDKEEMDDFIGQRIATLVNDFKKEMLDAFSSFSERLDKFGITYNPEETIKDIVIFLAGNSCKAKWVDLEFRIAFKELFEGVSGTDFPENIIKVDFKNKKITPKNAVAKGALKFGDTWEVFNHKKDDTLTMPLKYYVGAEDDEEFSVVLRKNENSKSDWKNLTQVNDKGCFTVYYSESSRITDIEEAEYIEYRIPEKIFKDDPKHRTVYVKPNDEYKIDYAISNLNGDNLDSPLCKGTILLPNRRRKNV